jgi:hypothetical protein
MILAVLTVSVVNCSLMKRYLGLRPKLYEDLRHEVKDLLLTQRKANKVSVNSAANDV